MFTIGDGMSVARSSGPVRDRRVVKVSFRTATRFRLWPPPDYGTNKIMKANSLRGVTGTKAGYVDSVLFDVMRAKTFMPSPQFVERTLQRDRRMQDRPTDATDREHRVVRPGSNFSRNQRRSQRTTAAAASLLRPRGPAVERDAHACPRSSGE